MEPKIVRLLCAFGMFSAGSLLVEEWHWQLCGMLSGIFFIWLQWASEIKTEQRQEQVIQTIIGKKERSSPLNETCCKCEKACTSQIKINGSAICKECMDEFMEVISK